MNPDIKTGATWKHGNHRITYRPDWDEKFPFISYYHGVAGRHFSQLDVAQYNTAGPRREWTFNP